MSVAFKVKKHVTLPLLKLRENNKYYLKFVDPMFVGKKIKDDDKKEAATLANVINLETGELCQIICATVLKGLLHETYPDDGYVGKSFQIEPHRVMDKTDPNKLKYNGFSLTEIEVEGDEAPEGADTAKTPGKAKK